MLDIFCNSRSQPYKEINSLCKLDHCSPIEKVLHNYEMVQLKKECVDLLQISFVLLSRCASYIYQLAPETEGAAK